MSSEPIRVVLVDDHPLVLDGIRARLEEEAGISVVGEACNGQRALEQAKALEPDVMLMDVSMPVMNGFEATRALREQCPNVRVLILSMHDNREYILQLIQSGASGYILKDVSSEEMVKAIETVHQGGTYFSSGASQTLFSRFDEPATPVQDTGVLTRRELTVLKLLAEGRNNKEIARELDISVRTVETHRQNIKSKLNIQTAAGLVRYAIEHNLVQMS
ncbi:DNA-binding response regulator, LuxR family [Marinobacterium lacunae]|uniref:DNA-binding response regulator, LuxR family n=1 Tax=Marinobacterium lacunae TaxID=1232683 RepID=A0A081G4J0_9GAMM|nr:response regulator transcription factor [Marinobacterium lacunae]KEA65695.1 DNA-binding response regulator, LuxR family [Marinobacterium lacunae]MBR9884060.1 response regulator transcription factor [Oceanospirillales bacterium]